MLQAGKYHQERIKTVKIVNPSDFLTDEEDGYTKEERDRIECEMQNLPKEKSLKLIDLIAGTSSKKIKPKSTIAKSKKRR
jgi:hypothetical protein